MRRRNGFTLVELLVVIGIITVLIAILLPVLNKAREQALMVKCQSNIRQILQAMVMYGNANQGVLPIPGAAGEQQPFYGVMNLAGGGGYADYDYTQGTLWPYVAASPHLRQALFTCPSDDYDRFGGYATGNFSYNFSVRLLGLYRLGQPLGVKLVKIVSPCGKLLVIEEENPVRPVDEPVQPMAQVINGTYTQYTEYMLTTRHQGMANAGFADGHVDTLSRGDFPDLLTAPGQAAYGRFVVLTSNDFRGRP